MWQIQNVIAQFIGQIKNRRHGDGIGDPYQYDREGKIDAELDGHQRGKNHVPGHGQKTDKQAGRHAAGDGAPGQMENVRVMKNIAEDLQVLVFPDLMNFRQYPFEEFFKHHDF